jgi:hypothetical protein
VKPQPGKPVRLIPLPNISRGVSNGTNAMHVFAVATGGRERRPAGRRSGRVPARRIG